MRVSKWTEDELIDRIAVVFRKNGYAGASLSAISKATGLERASLYHRFPGGKEQMAEAVLVRISKQLDEQLFQPIKAVGHAGQKVAMAVRVLGKFYSEGHLPCILETMSLEGADTNIRKALASSTNAFLDAFRVLSKELGAKEPRGCAARALASLEGALIVSRATGDVAHFKNALAHLEAVLKGSM